MSYEVICERCKLIICILDRNPGLSVHYNCIPEEIRHEEKIQNLATSAFVVAVNSGAKQSGHRSGKRK